MRRHWKMIVVLAVVAALALTAAAVALGAGPADWRSRGGACGTLLSNPKAQKAMQELRVEHQKEMRAWFDTYGADPTGAEAQAALQQLRSEHRQDMQALFKKLGIKAPAGVGSSGGGPVQGGCGGSCFGGGAAAGTQGSSPGGMMGGSSY